MGKTSATARDKWKKAHYQQVNISVKREIAAAFKAACKADNISVTGELSNFMGSRSGYRSECKTAKDLLATRGGRRKLLRGLMQQLEQIKDAEERYRDAIPENLQGSANYDAAEQSISVIEEVLDALSDAY